MFFHAKILTRKGPLAFLWHVVHGNRKITKQELKSLNLTDYILSVTDPVVPLALRLSGDLMAGAVRVFCARVTLVRKESGEALVALRIEAINAPPGQVPVIEVAVEEPDAAEAEIAGLGRKRRRLRAAVRAGDKAPLPADFVADADVEGYFAAGGDAPAAGEGPPGVVDLRDLHQSFVRVSGGVRPARSAQASSEPSDPERSRAAASDAGGRRADSGALGAAAALPGLGHLDVDQLLGDLPPMPPPGGDDGFHFSGGPDAFPPAPPPPPLALEEGGGGLGGSSCRRCRRRRCRRACPPRRTPPARRCVWTSMW